MRVFRVSNDLRGRGGSGEGGGNGEGGGGERGRGLPATDNKVKQEDCWMW